MTSKLGTAWDLHGAVGGAVLLLFVVVVCVGVITEMDIKKDLDQLLLCAVPIHVSKYTTFKELL